MVSHRVVKLAASLALGCSLVFTAGCGSQATTTAEDTQEQEAPAAEAQEDVLADGSYQIEVDTDSSMFRAEHCELTVKDGVYTAVLSLPGEGFSKLYFGTAEDAATADEADVYEYYLNDDGLYTFDLPVSALDEELTIAAYGQRRDTWYDHTITFASPEV